MVKTKKSFHFLDIIIKSKKVKVDTEFCFVSVLAGRDPERVRVSRFLVVYGPSRVERFVKQTGVRVRLRSVCILCSVFIRF